jgi:hypothetical protein
MHGWSGRQDKFKHCNNIGRAENYSGGTSGLRRCPAHSTIAAASSLVPASAAGEVIDLAAIAAAQEACTSTQQAAHTSSLHVKTFEVEGVSLLCDTSTGAARPLVPALHRRLLFNDIHNLAHPGVRATKRLIKSRFVWPGIGTDIADWCSECQACNQGKVTRHVRAPLQAIAVPDRRFSHLHVDLGCRCQHHRRGILIS